MSMKIMNWELCGKTTGLGIRVLPWVSSRLPYRSAIWSRYEQCPESAYFCRHQHLATLALVSGDTGCCENPNGPHVMQPGGKECSLEEQMHPELSLKG
uniref:uncharacterized protein LOC129500169 isoform X5 n=1 Tax=Nyctereutes procyonoides TaxID=34880 RepID=UPI002444FFF5|nr:uncharacterized protein LOC129500169 isoform X5 [Nyctereutes procyonoides]